MGACQYANTSARYYKTMHVHAAIQSSSCCKIASQYKGDPRGAIPQHNSGCCFGFSNSYYELCLTEIRTNLKIEKGTLPKIGATFNKNTTVCITTRFCCALPVNSQEIMCELLAASCSSTAASLLESGCGKQRAVRRELRAASSLESGCGKQRPVRCELRAASLLESLRLRQAAIQNVAVRLCLNRTGWRNL
jgi:hypothetical protein